MRYSVLAVLIAFTACNTAGGRTPVSAEPVAAALSDLPDQDASVPAETELPAPVIAEAQATPVPMLGLNLEETLVGAKSVLKIIGVRPDTAAANADLHIGDLLLALNGRDVRTLQDYDRELVRIGQSGVRTILVRVFDAGQEFDIPVVLNP